MYSGLEPGGETVRAGVNGRPPNHRDVEWFVISTVHAGYQDMCKSGTVMELSIVFAMLFRST